MNGQYGQYTYVAMLFIVAYLVIVQKLFTQNRLIEVLKSNRSTMAISDKKIRFFFKYGLKMIKNIFFF